MNLQKQLEQQGWHIRPVFLSQLLGEGTSLSSVTESSLLNCDLREVGIGCLSEELAKNRDGYIQGAHVLQLVSVRNIAQPMQQDGEGSSSRRKLMLITLTDGRMPIRCLDEKATTSLTTDSCPGLKILLKGGTIKKAMVILQSDNLQVLGGKVESLAEEWEFRRVFGRIRSKTENEDEAPRFHHFNPHAPRARIDLGGFSTFDILSKPSEGQKEDGPSSSGPRIDVSAKVVYNNQDEVRDKLLAEMPVPSTSSRPSRGRGRRGHGRGRQQETSGTQTKTLTLEEYEARQSSSGKQTDEQLARRLDEELNIATTQSSVAEAEKDLMASMFTYTSTQNSHSDHRSRGRGRGRGGGRGRGRGRGRRR